MSDTVAFDKIFYAIHYKKEGKQKTSCGVAYIHLHPDVEERADELRSNGGEIVKIRISDGPDVWYNHFHDTTE